MDPSSININDIRLSAISIYTNKVDDITIFDFRHDVPEAVSWLFCFNL